MTSSPRTPPISLAWLVWGIGAALYFVGFYQRVAPAVITAELSQAFNLTAAGLGNLSAFYFYSYVAMQIPTGLLADRYGPRILLTCGAAIAACGTAVFAMAQDVFWANTGRLLIGGSVGVAFVAMLKLAAHWMPARQFALASAAALAVGVFGAVAAGAPLRLLVDAFGWRNIMWASAACTLLIACAAWWIVRDDPADRQYLSHSSHHTENNTQSVWAGLLEVLSYRNTVLLFFLSGSMTGLVLTFAGLWGVPFLTTQYGLTQTFAAGLCSTMMVAWALGTLVFSTLSDHIGKRRPLYIGGVVAALALWSVLIYSKLPSTVMLAMLVAGIGFCAGSFIISFAFAKESVPARLAGTASGVANMGVIAGPMLLQPLVGVVLDRSWQGTLGTGAFTGKRVFDFSAYSQAFSMMLVWGALSIVLLTFTRETHCQQRQ
ncbi:MAG: MFS transporter [Rhodocyclaceae bacterium]|nr:MFS transporter [Rhodocyclaceae bacterium]MCA3026003.1 MFS transporter [Rhodocyclaceae bacterium]MCA3031716.1 MFS transporter [Rhodocyclaceae bacterium]MCA3038697.1 MFS transporter [Rhodocyclaceae bacterium]MCA3047220.1 MFS transporter [Rhodocyclaceae bacterium]